MSSDPSNSKAWRRAASKLMHKIYFNKKRREEIKKDFTKMLEIGLKMLELNANQTDIKSGKDRILAETMIDCANRYLETVKMAEKKDPFRNQYGKFKLYEKGKEKVFYLENFRAGKIRKGFMLLPTGLPQKGKVDAFINKIDFNSSGYNEIEKGKFHVMQTDFQLAKYTMWGRKRMKYIFYVSEMVSKKLLKGYLSKRK